MTVRDSADHVFFIFVQVFMYYKLWNEAIGSKNNGYSAVSMHLILNLSHSKCIYIHRRVETGTLSPIFSLFTSSDRHVSHLQLLFGI